MGLGVLQQPSWTYYRAADEAALNSEVLDVMHGQTNPRTCTTWQDCCHLSDSCISSAV